jgi:SAM-dependent methyltransferase
MSDASTTPGPHSGRSFDERAATWDADPTKVSRANAIAAAIARDVPLSRAMRALEYGCGTGLVTFALRERVGDVTLADLSDGMLDVVRQKIVATGDVGLHAAKLDLLADPLPEHRFDVVYSAMTLHHVPDTDAILRRFHAVLARPGWLAIADLDAEDGSFHGAGFDGHHGFDRDDLARRTRAAGFAHVRFSTAYEMQKEAAGAMRTYPIFLMVAGTGA